MTRGDLVSIAMQGDFGKPRPALRITVEPNAGNGLRQTSQVMVDKTLTVKREKIGVVFGRIDAEALLEIERCLAVFLGIAK
jgi:mRNA interferase MazF